MIGRHNDQRIGMLLSEGLGMMQRLLELFYLANLATWITFVALLVDGSGFDHQKEPLIVISR